MDYKSALCTICNECLFNDDGTSAAGKEALVRFDCQNPQYPDYINVCPMFERLSLLTHVYHKACIGNANYCPSPICNAKMLRPDEVYSVTNTQVKVEATVFKNAETHFDRIPHTVGFTIVRSCTNPCDLHDFGVKLFYDPERDENIITYDDYRSGARVKRRKRQDRAAGGSAGAAAGPAEAAAESESMDLQLARAAQLETDEEVARAAQLVADEEMARNMDAELRAADSQPDVVIVNPAPLSIPAACTEANRLVERLFNALETTLDSVFDGSNSNAFTLNEDLIERLKTSLPKISRLLKKTEQLFEENQAELSAMEDKFPYRVLLSRKLMALSVHLLLDILIEALEDELNNNGEGEVDLIDTVADLSLSMIPSMRTQTNEVMKKFGKVTFSVDFKKIFCGTFFRVNQHFFGEKLLKITDVRFEQDPDKETSRLLMERYQLMASNSYGILSQEKPDRSVVEFFHSELHPQLRNSRDDLKMYKQLCKTISNKLHAEQCKPYGSEITGECISHIYDRILKSYKIRDDICVLCQQPFSRFKQPDSEEYATLCVPYWCHHGKLTTDPDRNKFSYHIYHLKCYCDDGKFKRDSKGEIMDIYKKCPLCKAPHRGVPVSHPHDNVFIFSVKDFYFEREPESPPDRKSVV